MILHSRINMGRFRLGLSARWAAMLHAVCFESTSYRVLPPFLIRCNSLMHWYCHSDIQETPRTYVSLLLEGSPEMIEDAGNHL